MSGFDKYAVCECGWHRRAPFGELFHLHIEVCPDCGRSKWKMKVLVGRSVRDHWWQAPTFVPKEGTP